MSKFKLFFPALALVFLLSACNTPSQDTSQTPSDNTPVATSEPTLTNSTDINDLENELDSITVTDPTQELENSEKE